MRSCCLLTNDNSSPSNRPNKGRNAVINALEKKLSHSDVSPKEQMLLHSNLKVVSVRLPWKWLHVLQQDRHLHWQDCSRCACFVMVRCSCCHMPAGLHNIVMEHVVGTLIFVPLCVPHWILHLFLQGAHQFLV